MMSGCGEPGGRHRIVEDTGSIHGHFEDLYGNRIALVELRG